MQTQFGTHKEPLLLCPLLFTTVSSPNGPDRQVVVVVVAAMGSNTLLVTASVHIYAARQWPSWAPYSRIGRIRLRETPEICCGDITVSGTLAGNEKRQIGALLYYHFFLSLSFFNLAFISTSFKAVWQASNSKMGVYASKMYSGLALDRVKFCVCMPGENGI